MAQRSIHWDEFHRAARTLSRRLRIVQGWNKILAVTRGGLVPAGIIARELDVREIQNLCVRSYEAETKSGPASQQHDIRFLSPLPSGNGEGWLVVDDLADTGATLRAIKKDFPKAIYAAVYTKPEGRSALDHFAEEVPQSCWLNFPWDLECTYATPIADIPEISP